MSVQIYDPRRMPQAVRSEIAALEGDGMAAVDGDAAALEMLRDSREHINPRQAALFVAINRELRTVAMSRDPEAVRSARVAHGWLLQLYELEQLEDERTYGDGGALGHIQASHAADLAIVARSESMLAERRV